MYPHRTALRRVVLAPLAGRQVGLLQRWIWRKPQRQSSRTWTQLIRALAQTNAFHINSSRALSFIGINQAVILDQFEQLDRQLRPASPSEQRMVIPTSGRTFQAMPTRAAWTLRRGRASGTNNVVAVVTRARFGPRRWRDAVAVITAMLLNDASAVATRIPLAKLSGPPAEFSLETPRCRTGGIAWFYYNRCFATAGANAIGLKAGFDNLGGWHNSLKINYNSQQTYCLGGPVNHPEFIQPFVDAIIRNLPAVNGWQRTRLSG